MNHIPSGFIRTSEILRCGIWNRNEPIIDLCLDSAIDNGPPATEDALLMQLFVQSLDGAFT